MVKRRKLCVLAVALLPFATLSSGSSSVAEAAAVTTVTSATLFGETPGLLESTAYPSSVAMDHDHGWTFSYYNSNENTNGNFSAYATDTSHTAGYGFTLAHSSFVAAQRGARRVELDLDLNGSSCGDGLDGQVKDFASAAGDVTRLDVVFSAWCAQSQESGYISGEIQFNEPVTGTVRSMPSGLLFPPANTRSSTRRTYPVKLYGTTPSGTSISGVRLTGKDKSRFRMSRDTCIGATVTETSPCTVRVHYRPGGTEDVASLVATSSADAVISTTSLDGALLPGHSYWGVNDRSGELRLGAPAVYRPGAGTEIELEGQARGTSELVFVLPNGDNDGVYESITLQAPSAFHVGDYKVVSGYRKRQAGSVATVSYDYNAIDEPVTSGTLRIRQLGLTRTDRGLELVPAVALSLKLNLSGSARPVYLSLGYLATGTVLLPDVSRPPRLTHLRAAHARDVARISWAPSSDLAVDHYIVRVRRGVHRFVGWREGAVARSVKSRITLRGRRYTHPFSISGYAVDSTGQHGPGRTLVVR